MNIDSDISAGSINSVYQQGHIVANKVQAS